MKALFVTRDRKPGMIGTRIAAELARRDVAISIVAEGLSAVEWKNADLHYDYFNAGGPLDIKEPWDISPKDVFYNTKPDVVVCGLSSPIRSEAWFAAGARNTECSGGVPLVVLDDNWGATYRCQVQADLVLTIDELGKRLVESNPVYKGHEYRLEIIGDLSATAASEPVPQATIDAFNKAKGDAEYAFLLCSQKWPESDDIIEIGLDSCALSLKAGTKLVVIPRIHPGAGIAHKAYWNGKIAAFGEKHPGVIQEIVDTPEAKHNTDHLATLADGVFAATGSALRAAAYAGKIPICIWTPRLGEKLKAESGMINHPLVEGGAAMQIYGDMDVVSLFVKHGDRVRRNQEKLLQPVPFDAVKAADAILAIAKE